MPSVGQMNDYANDQYSLGAYKEYAGARGLKLATAAPRLAAIKELAQGRRLLDVGCATGFFLEIAAEQGFEVRGMEFSRVAISLARPDIRDRILCGDVNELSKELSSKFDVVTAFDIIEHVRDPRGFLDQIREMLAPGGVIVISTPDTGHFLRHVMGSSWPMLQPMQHMVLFSRRGMAAVMRDAGYSDVKVQTARKFLTMEYLAEQLVATNPAMHKAYRLVRNAIPRAVRERAFALNIGEMIVYARKA